MDRHTHRDSTGGKCHSLSHGFCDFCEITLQKNHFLEWEIPLGASEERIDSIMESRNHRPLHSFFNILDHRFLERLQRIRHYFLLALKILNQQKRLSALLSNSVKRRQ